jgi:hypothetical protein
MLGAPCAMDSLIVGIVGVLEGAIAVGGLRALGAGLYGIGIPKNSVLDYEAALKSDKFLKVLPRNSREQSTFSRVKPRRSRLTCTVASQSSLPLQSQRKGIDSPGRRGNNEC